MNCPACDYTNSPADAVCGLCGAVLQKLDPTRPTPPPVPVRVPPELEDPSPASAIEFPRMSPDVSLGKIFRAGEIGNPGGQIQSFALAVQYVNGPRLAEFRAAAVHKADGATSGLKRQRT